MIIDFLQKNEDVAEMGQQLGGFLTHWLPMFEAENRSYLAVGIGCTGGRYRSVYIANRPVTTFRGRGRPTLRAKPFKVGHGVFSGISRKFKKAL